MGLESDKCYAFTITEMKGRLIGYAMPKQPQVYKFRVRVLRDRQLDHMRISMIVCTSMTGDFLQGGRCPPDLICASMLLGRHDDDILEFGIYPFHIPMRQIE